MGVCECQFLWLLAHYSPAAYKEVEETKRKDGNWREPFIWRSVDYEPLYPLHEGGWYLTSSLVIKILRRPCRGLQMSPLESSSLVFDSQRRNLKELEASKLMDLRWRCFLCSRGKRRERERMRAWERDQNHLRGTLPMRTPGGAAGKVRRFCVEAVIENRDRYRLNCAP